MGRGFYFERKLVSLMFLYCQDTPILAVCSTFRHQNALIQVVCPAFRHQDVYRDGLVRITLVTERTGAASYRVLVIFPGL